MKHLKIIAEYADGEWIGSIAICEACKKVKKYMKDDTDETLHHKPSIWALYKAYCVSFDYLYDSCIHIKNIPEDDWKKTQDMVREVKYHVFNHHSDDSIYDTLEEAKLDDDFIQEVTYLNGKIIDRETVRESKPELSDQFEVGARYRALRDMVDRNNNFIGRDDILREGFWYDETHIGLVGVVYDFEILESAITKFERVD